VATHTPPPFPQGTVEDVAKIIGDLYRGSELTRILAQARIADPLGEGATKWKRLAEAISDKQVGTGNGGAVIGLIHAAMAPTRTLNRRVEASIARDELNQALSLPGYCVKENGRVGTTTRATTDTEAAARSTRLHTLLTDRGGHADVLRYCRPELLRTDFYEAVFESIKGLGHRLRSMSGGTDEDGPKLVESVLEGADPMILLNDRANRSQQDEQRGVAHLIKGLFAAFRNPAAHEPRIVWSMSELDALDVLGTLSMVHRRLDAARLRT
jgi:uncharacterized protein (TIGR02391 family)